MFPMGLALYWDLRNRVPTAESFGDRLVAYTTTSSFCSRWFLLALFSATPLKGQKKKSVTSVFI